jgi:Mycothiol maleylpyruvate isomerase N-terminal domain
VFQHPAAVRAAFEEAAATFLATVTKVQQHQWDLPGVGVWNVRELTAHTLRALTTIEQYLMAEPIVDRVLDDATDYYRTALGDANVHASVAERGRAAGAQLTDPVGESEATAQRVLALVASTADDEPVNTSVGQMMFSEYLATRTAELALHTIDIQRATGQATTLHPATSSLVVGVVGALADPIRLLCALTGRGALPDDYNVLG